LIFEWLTMIVKTPVPDPGQVFSLLNNSSPFKNIFHRMMAIYPCRESSLVASYPISSMLVLYGAEFTHAYAIRNSGKVIPTGIAETKILPKNN